MLPCLMSAGVFGGVCRIMVFMSGSCEDNSDSRFASTAFVRHLGFSLSAQRVGHYGWWGIIMDGFPKV
jgi:hypothetical protein